MGSVSEEYPPLRSEACPRPHCTELLKNPAGVLAQRQRWPNHVCYENFLTASTQFWASEKSGMGRLGTLENSLLWRWLSWWPLPIGRKSLERAHIETSPNLPARSLQAQDFILASNMMPFEEREEAIWALRVERGSAALDLFGLANYRTEEGGLNRHAPTITAGGLAYVLRGQDTSLIDLVHAAKRWWAEFQGLTFRGRPPGSGEWQSREYFEAELRRAASEIRSEGSKITQESVAAHLNTSSRLIRHWLFEYNIRWPDIKWE
jgi:hypothetical protein